MEKILPLSPLNLKGKKARHLECRLGPPHWLHEISLPKRVCHHFWPGLIMEGAEIWGHKLGVLILFHIIF
jgi:hypothetical protein